MDILGKLLGSPHRVRLLRFFLLNPELALAPREVAERTRVKPLLARRECALFKSIGLVRIVGSRLQFNPKFPLAEQIQKLLVAASPVTAEEVVRRLGVGGKLKLVVLAGIFLSVAGKSRADLLVVGDQLKRATLEAAIRQIEAEMGRELSYALFETDDFNYRRGIFDKFILDILDAPHRVLLDKIGL